MSRCQNFNLMNEFNILSIICELFFIRILREIFVPEALGFFKTAGFKPAKSWMYLSCAIEILLAIGLIFGVYTAVAGTIAAVHLLVAATAVWKVTGKWLWNIGGYEYCLFWAICCCVVAIHG